jgi:hypothetical protein
VAFVGSAFTLLMGASMIAVTLGGGSSTPVPPKFGVGIGLLFIAFAALGVVTGLGVLRLREWARIAMLVFSGAMALFCAAGALIVATMPIPSTSPAGVGTARVVIASVYGIPLAVGVWWMVLFTRRSVVEAFSGGAVAAASGRPLAVTLIGYWNVVGGVGTVLASFLGMPAFVLGAVIPGWAGSATYLFLGALTFYAGVGLLRLRESARVLAITLFGLTIVQTAIMFVSPAARTRMLAAQNAMAPDAAAQPMPFDPHQMALGFMGIAALIAVAMALLLVRAKGAFEGGGVGTGNGERAN